MPDRNFSAIGRRFGDLRVRPKLMVLHNLFFLVLTVAVYFSLMPLVEGKLKEARRREVSLIVESFQKAGPAELPRGLEAYELTTGTADELGMPLAVRAYLERQPGAVWHDVTVSEFIYKKDIFTSRYYRLRLPLAFYDTIVEAAKVAVFGVLGVVYVLAVLLLELVILPRYVYGPIHVLLDADEATRRGDREREIIPEREIPGDEVGQIMTSHNSTVRELRRHEAELKQTLERLEAQDRLVSLGLLSTSVAHEMNTPLAVLHGSIEKMLETAEPGPVRQRLERIIRVTTRLRRISEALLDFARVRQRERAVVELRPVVDEAWGLVAIDEKASDVNFRNELAGGASVMGNADQLVQVFVNLLRNALNAVARGGEILVELRPATLDGKPAHAILVEDNGPGIPPEMLQQVFEAFVTTRLDARGTGLGLTIAQGIVSQHGGAIAASNRKGGGACLEVRLPRQEVTT